MSLRQRQEALQRRDEAALRYAREAPPVWWWVSPLSTWAASPSWGKSPLEHTDVARLGLVAEVGMKLGSHGHQGLSNERRVAFHAIDLHFARVRAYYARTSYPASYVTRPSVQPPKTADRPWRAGFGPSKHRVNLCSKIR